MGPWKNTDVKFYTLKRLYWSPGPIKILGIQVSTDYQEVHYHNYEKLMDKVDEILGKWKQHILTLISKIVIVNTLINSLFVHKLTALPSPLGDFYNRYKKKIEQFLWEGKIPKIKYNKLVQNYDKMGLKLVDLRAKEYAIKAALVIKNAEKGEEISWLYHTLPIKDKRIWECNLDPEDVNRMTHGHLDISWSMLVAWSKFNYDSVIDNTEQMLHSPIWGNSLIRKVNRPIFDREIIDSNIETILQIYDVNNRFLTFQELINQFGVNFEYLYYYGILATIPRLWKHTIKNANFDKPFDYVTKRELLISQGKISQQIYWDNIERIFPILDTAKFRWETNLGLQIPDGDWLRLYINIRRMVKITKYSIFNIDY